MIDEEGVCDDCGGAMEDKGNNIWYCPHCELYLEWHSEAWYYVCLSDVKAFEKTGLARVLTMNVTEPTVKQCDDKDLVFEDEQCVGYACWYPQMGGYSGKTIAFFNKKIKSSGEMMRTADCVDVLVWHDGEFPFSSSECEPTSLHHCDPAQFIEFGVFMEKINDSLNINEV